MPSRSGEADDQHEDAGGQPDKFVAGVERDVMAAGAVVDHQAEDAEKGSAEEGDEAEREGDEGAGEEAEVADGDAEDGYAGAPGARTGVSIGEEPELLAGIADI